MTERKEVEIENERGIWSITNEDPNVQPLILVVPQWAKKSIDKLPTRRQAEVYDQFVHEVSEAWGRLLNIKV